MMPVVDEYSRECLSIDVERSITAGEVIETLASLFRRRGGPTFIRSDNGAEFVAKAIKRWLEASGVETLYIEPGSPWENAYSETFISRFSDELLKRGNSSAIYSKLRCRWRITANTKTTTGHTAHWATKPQHDSRRLQISPGRWRMPAASQRS
jgi:transposase InsO family protein